jgi:hypothetical protein
MGGELRLSGVLYGVGGNRFQPKPIRQIEEVEREAMLAFRQRAHYLDEDIATPEDARQARESSFCLLITPLE